MAAWFSVYRVDSHEALASARVGSFRAFVEEWVELNEASSSRAAVVRWGHLEPVMSRFSALGQIPRFVDEAELDAKDDVLAALVRLAQSGQSLAARTLLQCLLPALTKIVKTSRPSYLRDCDMSGEKSPLNRADEEHFLVSTCWLLIMDYPLDRRPRKIAANLVLDTKKKALASPKSQQPISVPLELVADVAEIPSFEAEVFADRQLELFSRDLSACLRWAVSIGALNSAEGELLSEALLDSGMRRPLVDTTGRRINPVYQTLADERGLSYETLAKQVTRAKARLVKAINEDILQPKVREEQQMEMDLCIS